MNKLNTLIEDIYSTISCIADGKDLDIPETLAADFGDRMAEALLHWAKPKKQTKGLRMSNIGKPARQLWYEHRDNNNENKISPDTLIKFLYGHLLEEVLLLLVKLSGHEVTDEQKEVEVDGIVGHIDCKIDGEVIDVKTSSGRAFNKFTTGSLAENDPFGYIAQLCGYEEAEGTNDGGFLAINKESGELALYRPEELDKINIKSRIRDIKAAIKFDEPPTRCYNEEPDGKSGNMKINKNCYYCPYKFKCYSNVNEGKGLRTFMYARGPVYLTRVSKKPRVDEEATA